MARPKIKECLKRKGISISLSADTLKLLRKQKDNISAYIERLIVKDLAQRQNNEH